MMPLRQHLLWQHEYYSERSWHHQSGIDDPQKERPANPLSDKYARAYAAQARESHQHTLAQLAMLHKLQNLVASAPMSHVTQYSHLERPHANNNTADTVMAMVTTRTRQVS